MALFVAARGDAAEALAAAAKACEERLPSYKRPKWIRLVAELPRTATGKIQRFKLRKMVEREIAAPGRPETDGLGPTAPRSG